MKNRKVKEKKVDIQERTFDFALMIIKVVNILPRNMAGIALGRQIIRSGTSVGANVEEAQGARSKKGFINSINIAKKEARETRYQLRLIITSRLSSSDKLRPALNESEAIIKILTSIVKTSEEKTYNA